MPDIRLVRPHRSKFLLAIGALLAIGLIAWTSPYVFGDATAAKQRGIGAKSGLGEVRAPVLPPRSVAFASVDPIEAKDLGRLVRLSGTAETRTYRGAVWVRSTDGRRILLRWEPLPEAGTLRTAGPGGRVEVDGYIQRISRAEFGMWIDSLGAYVPKPPPGVKFGDQPDSSFARLDSLFIKEFYVSARPGLETTAAR